MSDHIPRETAFFPISVVQEITSLTARQIRYYEEQGLIKPVRNRGNQRLFSLEDIDHCAEIKSLIDKGLNIAGIKAILEARQTAPDKTSPRKKIVKKEEIEHLLEQWQMKKGLK
ncbi:MerR family transcriptional regulator [Thalassorhabdus alkalitolerans]|uniref:MerR family transcriptional regulator n=1 Tax=Thalassorhabdus alkalitolerans TaxID=2282697 RepID=A0ABW0YMJ5_9BACI|nr:MerR family transcriptional regulator [Thalassobacillus sp. C254]